MAYTALPDRRMPYDNDGTVVVTSGGAAFGAGAISYPSGTDLISVNGYAWNVATGHAGFELGSGAGLALWMFFPEQREITGMFMGYFGGEAFGAVTMEGSSDTTNGLDGTWETASLAGGAPWMLSTQKDDFRSHVKSVSFTGPKKAIRVHWVPGGGTGGHQVRTIHVYGQKAAGQTPDDILFLNGLTSYAEFAAPEDFGDVPLATSSVRTFKVKNGSATKTANTINLQCNDADFVISTDNVTWVTTINISSLAAGASSAVLYVRNTSPAIGSALGPRFARIVATVASYT